jgi:hypothetical protein
MVLEPMSIIGGIASLAQILDITVKATDRLSQFIRDVRDAPSEIMRLQGKVLVLQSSLQATVDFAHGVDEELFPQELKALLLEALFQVQRDIAALSSLHRDLTKKTTGSLRRKLLWGFVDRACAQRLQEHVRETEETLANVLQLLTL